MAEVSTIGLDIAKHVFQAHGADASGARDVLVRDRRQCINARLGGDAVRYTFIVEDVHLLLLAGLPAHYA